jgi:hypothetical protein
VYTTSFYYAVHVRTMPWKVHYKMMSKQLTNLSTLTLYLQLGSAKGYYIKNPTSFVIKMNDAAAPGGTPTHKILSSLGPKNTKVLLFPYRGKLHPQNSFTRSPFLYREIGLRTVARSVVEHLTLKPPNADTSQH